MSDVSSQGQGTLDPASSTVKDRIMAADANWRSEEKLRAFTEQSLVGVAILREDGFDYVNGRLCEMFGYSPDEMVELPVLEIVYPTERDRVLGHMRQILTEGRGSMSIEFRGITRDGNTVHAEVSDSVAVVDGKPVLIRLVADVTDRKRAERKVEMLETQLSQHMIRDALTGLYNQQYVEESLERELARARRYSQPVSVIMGDVDNFKDINAQHGHHGGDELLKALGGVFKNCCRKSDISYRCGGEEFLLTMGDMSVSNAMNRAEELRGAIERTEFIVGGKPVSLTLSFGVATFPQHGTTSEGLVEAAEKAMLTSKEAGRNRVRAAG